MIQSTEGIVLNAIRYGDSSRIVKIFTRTSGMKSFLVRLGSGPKSDKTICSVFNLVECNYHLTEMTGLIKPSGLRRSVPLPGLSIDPVKSAMTIFLAEVLYKTLEDDYQNVVLYDFLRESIISLDRKDGAINFHLWVLARLISFYGFEPDASEMSEGWFDMRKGLFSRENPVHGQSIPPPLSQLFLSLFSIPGEQAELLPLDNNLRMILLEKLLEYMAIHLENMREINSHKILHEVFR
jgi:DNA repair protein RecO (recombination protein O)